MGPKDKAFLVQNDTLLIGSNAETATTPELPSLEPAQTAESAQTAEPTQTAQTTDSAKEPAGKADVKSSVKSSEQLTQEIDSILHSDNSKPANGEKNLAEENPDFGTPDLPADILSGPQSVPAENQAAEKKDSTEEIALPPLDQIQR